MAIIWLNTKQTHHDMIHTLPWKHQLPPYLLFFVTESSQVIPHRKVLQYKSPGFSATEEVGDCWWNPT